MTRPISHHDIEYQHLEGSPIKIEDRLSEWTRTEGLHHLHLSDAPTTLPSVLEVITQGPGEAGILIAADRLRTLYEAGVKVVSTSDILFGNRIMTHELPD